MKFFIFILIFLIISFLIIINNNDLKLSRQGDFQKFSGFYSDWAGNFYFNIKSVTGNIIKLDWFPE